MTNWTQDKYLLNFSFAFLNLQLRSLDTNFNEL